MTTITLPPDIEQPLAEKAHKLGTTPEHLAIESLRELFAPSQAKKNLPENKSLFDFLAGYAGTIDGTTEALSENCGERFTQSLQNKQRENP